MHGLIYSYLNKFVNQTAGDGAWGTLLQKANLEGFTYSPMKGSPDEPILKLVQAASDHLDLPVPKILHLFGAYLGPELAKLYRNRLHPDWKTFEVLLAAEKTMHEAVRRDLETARPPVLDAVKSSQQEMHLIYNSERQLCHVAEGIIHGLGDHFREDIHCEHTHCVHRGDAFCVFEIRRATTDVPLEKPHQKAGPLPEKSLSPDLTRAIAPSSPPPDPNQESTMLVPLEEFRAEIPGEFESFAEQKMSDGTFFFLEPALQEGDLGSIGHYRIKGLVGEGAMGIVFDGFDTRLERAVAIKVMRPQFSEAKEIRARFDRESRAVASLKNPHIVTIYGVGAVKGMPYLVMERLYGQPLSKSKYQKDSFDLDETLKRMRQMALGLDAAHREGLIHRDIKPANVWVEQKTGIIKLLDFGLAKSSETDVEITSEGALMGTPSFMSPEQSDGEVIDYRSDMFSLGAVFHWMLTGRSPFGRKSVMKTLSALANEPIPNSKDVNPEVPDALASLVMNLLEKDPDQRLITAKQVIEEIARITKVLFQPILDKQSRFPDQNPNPVFRANLANRLLYANPACKKLLDRWQIEEGDHIPEPCASAIFGAKDSEPFIFQADAATCRINVVRSEEDGYLSVYGFYLDGWQPPED